jgi:hypothetical protein
MKVAQEEDTHKKRKYDNGDPCITLKDDDIELVTDKVQDRGEEVVKIAEE